MLRNIPEERRSHLDRGGSLKSWIGSFMSDFRLRYFSPMLHFIGSSLFTGLGLWEEGERTIVTAEAEHYHV
jgi:hypothetical protein